MTKTAYEYPTKCTSNSRSGEKQSDTIILLGSPVPHAQVEYNAREETTFCNTEKEAGSKESGEIAGDAHEGTNDTPREGEGRKPKSWSRESEGDIERDLEQDITDKVDGQCGEELVPGLFQMVVRITLTADSEEECAYSCVDP